MRWSISIWGDIILGYQSGLSVAARVFVRRKHDNQICQKKKMWSWNQRSEWDLWRQRKGPRDKERRWSLDAWKGREIDCPLETPEGIKPWWHLNFSPLASRTGRECVLCVVIGCTIYRKVTGSLWKDNMLQRGNEGKRDLSDSIAHTLSGNIVSPFSLAFFFFFD